MEDINRLLPISGNELGQHKAQHRSVVDAARDAGVSFIAYTSILHADKNLIGIAKEHLATEAVIMASRLPCALLRNGWYNENYTASAAPAIQHGAVRGSTGNARISAAARADYAAAAAAVLAEGGSGADIFELVGDQAFTLSDFAAMLADSSALAATGALFDDGGALGRLIGRPTITMKQSVEEALRA